MVLFGLFRPALATRGAEGPMLYCGPKRSSGRVRPGGPTIAEVLRHVWSRLIRKQWLFLYPLALAVVDSLAFLAVYAAGGEAIRWSSFFTANFERWQYVQDHFIDDFSFKPSLAVAVFAGIALCLLAAMIRAPFFRAVAGGSYPLAPRKWTEAGSLFLFYLLWNLVLWVVPMAGPTEGLLGQLVAAVVWIVGILVVFADYVIVYEDLGPPRALRRSLRLLRHSWLVVVAIIIILQLVYLGLYSLYGVYYRDDAEVSILLPISQMLVEAFIALIADLILIFLYEDVRRRSPA
jgi:hypothetical protein